MKSSKTNNTLQVVVGMGAFLGALSSSLPLHVTLLAAIGIGVLVGGLLRELSRIEKCLIGRSD